MLAFHHDAAGHLREIDDDDWFGGSGRRWRGLDQAVAEIRGSDVAGLYRDGTFNVTA